MLTLYHNNREIPLDTTEYYVRELASGMDEVIFDLSIWDPNYALMAEEENIVDRGGQRYLVKQVDAGAVTAKVVCQLDLDEWKASMLVGYNSGSKTVAQQIEAIKPTGWTVNNHSGVTISRTLHGDFTPLQVCEECRSTYQVYIRWDNKNKVCHIYKQALGTPVGAFATRELNLKEINYKGKSTNFATRLYAYGKDGLSFKDINNNKPYVDNNTYSSRVICAYWQDDRYTDKQSLLNDAIEHLAKLAVPERSYDCAIVDLQATNPEQYNNLDFSLFTTATLIDDIKGTAVDYMVVERHVWPYHPDHNDVIFNSAPIKIQNTVIQIEDELTNPNSTFQQILQAEIDLVTDWLTDNNSHCYITQNADGTIKDFIFVNGDEPIQTATQVMRINASGLGFSKTGVNGPYTNAFVFDSTMGGHLVADFITAGHMVADRIQGGTLESIDSTTIGGVTYKNFNLNMSTGLLQAVKLAIITQYFSLTEDGKITSMEPAQHSVTYQGETYNYFRSVLNSSEFKLEYCKTLNGPESYLIFMLHESPVSGRINQAEILADEILIKPLRDNVTNIRMEGAGSTLTADNLASYGFNAGGSSINDAHVDFEAGDVLVHAGVYVSVEDSNLNPHSAFNGTIQDANGINHSVINGIILDDEITP